MTADFEVGDIVRLISDTQIGLYTARDDEYRQGAPFWDKGIDLVVQRISTIGAQLLRTVTTFTEPEQFEEMRRLIHNLARHNVPPWAQLLLVVPVGVDRGPGYESWVLAETVEKVLTP